ncbi:amphoterin-induced protein 3-like [Schistocerca gregaria]|uniref:amphoterin-induced protein 3-like n=1 Tax=Schistocerca gregaria TaxID=7010 RepID=UPI00211F1E76|nr:amphoterin-induced protein 3-like [Schistocerca gregaria]XP_049862865.1 amphoterin-induced protein 3-like [Schistocerca gregaria]
MIWRWLLLLLAAALCCAAFELPDKGRGCVVLRTHGMLGADCSSRDLRDVPQNLDTRIQVLDVSDNKIRELTTNSLSKYSSLRFLYLGDNTIYLADDGVFSPLSSLEVLDLSLNVFRRIPFDVLRLPVLRKLDFSQNGILLDDPDVYKGAPVSNSLKVLSLAKNKLKEFPPLWMVPQLEYLNVSGNELRSIKITDIAPMCRLKEIDASHNSKLFKGGLDKCDCYLFSTWIERRNIKLIPQVSLNCPTTDTELCDNSTSLREALDLHSRCNSKVETFQRQAAIKKTWMWAGIAAAIIVIIVLTGALFMHCRNSSRRKVSANNNNQMACNDVKKMPPDPSSSQLLQDL